MAVQIIYMRYSFLGKFHWIHNNLLSTWPRPKARQRLADKLEFLDWDPTIGRQVLYREDKKIVSLREEKVKQVTRLKISNNIHNKWPTMALEPASD